MTRDNWKGGQRSRITPKSRLNSFLGPEPTICVDCGEVFDPEDDDARCPASNGTAYHRSEVDAR